MRAARWFCDVAVVGPAAVALITLTLLSSTVQSFTTTVVVIPQQSSQKQQRIREAVQPPVRQLQLQRQQFSSFSITHLLDGKSPELEQQLQNNNNNNALDGEEKEEESSFRTVLDNADATADYVDEEELEEDEKYMRMAILAAKSDGGEGSVTAAYPKATVGAVLVTFDGRILAQARSDYQQHAIQSVLKQAGVQATPLTEWCVTWPSSEPLRRDLASSTLYVTLEPTHQRQGMALPPLTQLIQQVGIPRVVIGCRDPVPELATKGASALHANGLDVTIGILEDECFRETLQGYAALANSKLRSMARTHFRLFGRPLGFLHCSVVDSDDLKAFANNGNAFGTTFGGKNLSFRDFGSYEIAPPPEVIWVESSEEDDDYDEDFLLGGYDNDYDFDMNDDFEVEFEDEDFEVDFEDEDFQGDIKGNPMMPWYEQADAVVATLPRPGYGPSDDNSLRARLNGLRWLATHGRSLPAGVERILVLDATDLKDVPLTNDNPHLVSGTASGGSSEHIVVDVEAFWKGQGRKPSRVLLRRGTNAQARAAAQAAQVASEAAAKAALAATEALEAGDAAKAANEALGYQKKAEKAIQFIQNELQADQAIKSQLERMGVIVETIEGGEPIDVMKHLGKRNGLHAVVWRAGCWGERGVNAILEGAFQWVSAHLAVDAIGGKFWQLMLAENAVQAACGPERKVKVFADQEDISLEYCDNPNADSDCSMRIGGRPVRHIRLDCRVALVDETRPREFVLAKTQKINRKILLDEAPWFL